MASLIRRYYRDLCRLGYEVLYHYMVFIVLVRMTLVPVIHQLLASSKLKSLESSTRLVVSLVKQLKLQTMRNCWYCNNIWQQADILTSSNFAIFAFNPWGDKVSKLVKSLNNHNVLIQLGLLAVWICVDCVKVLQI